MIAWQIVIEELEPPFQGSPYKVEIGPGSIRSNIPEHPDNIVADTGEEAVQKFLDFVQPRWNVMPTRVSAYPVELDPVKDTFDVSNWEIIYRFNSAEEFVADLDK
jgi:hypothetical protein